MTTSTVWLSFDLGVRGDYENLYLWLDQRGAKECVESVAVFSYEYKGSIIDSLKNELGGKVQLDKRSRIYAIYRDRKTNKNKGIFIFGGRRAPTWSGFAADGSDDSDDET